MFECTVVNVSLLPSIIYTCLNSPEWLGNSKCTNLNHIHICSNVSKSAKLLIRRALLAKSKKALFLRCPCGCLLPEILNTLAATHAGF